MLLIIGVYPANNEMNVPVGRGMEIFFSKSLEQSTIDPNTIFLQDVKTAEKVAGALTYDSVEMKVSLKPSAPLTGGKKYRLTVVGGNIGIYSKDNFMLAANRTYEFTTEPEAMQEPVIPAPPTPSIPSDPDDIGMLIEVADTYPKNGSVHVKPDSIKILLTSPVTAPTVNHHTVYLVKKPKPKELNLIDLMTDYAPSNSILDKSKPIELEHGGMMISVSLAAGLLEDNTEYTLIVREVVGDGTSSLDMAYASSFHTTFTPLYANPDAVRESMSKFFSGVTDIAMYRKIREASIEARDIVTTRDASIDLATNIPNYVEQYVLHKSTYELAVNAYIQMAGSNTGNRSLGDLSVDAGESTISATQVLRSLKERIKPWLDQLHGLNNRGYAKPGSTVKGENIEAYPDFFTRTEFTDLGG